MATAHPQPVFQIRNLTKTYGNGTQALKNVTFDVKEGEFLVVIGLSGSGKSTMLRCLNQLILPTGGEIYFKGKAIHQALPPAELRLLRKQVAMIFQQFNLVKRRSVLSNALTGSLGSTSTLPSLLGWFPEATRQRALECLKLVGLQEKARLRADSLSGGQQQRVAIARALMQQPHVLLADEPVASLDPSMAHSIMDYLEKINKELGVTVICNLHFLSLVRQYAQRVVALRAGELVFEGQPKEINEKWFKHIYGEEAREVHVQ